MTLATQASRLRLTGFGAATGVLLWFLAEEMRPLVGDGPWLAALTVALGLTAATGLITLGPVRLRGALAFAAASGLIAGLLTLLASPRFATAADLLSAPGVLTALFVLAAIPVPFRLAAARGTWRDPETVIETGCSLALRTIAALAFAGLVWLVIWLCDTLLGLVGLNLLDRLTDHEVLVWAVTGAIFGLGLAVMGEALEQVPLKLVARLLRLILAPLAAVVALFLILLPLQGVEEVFRSFSAATVILSIAIGAILLLGLLAVSAPEMEPSAIERIAGRGLALMLVPMAGIAIWALGTRIAAYGLTPERVQGALVTAATACIALAFAGAVIVSGRRWLDGLRRASLWMLGLVYLLAALSLTPLLDPFRLSVASQLARFADGRLPAADLPLVEMRFDWGRAGTAGLERLAAGAEPALAERLAGLATARTRYDASANVTHPPLDDLRAALVIRPEGAQIPPGIDLTRLQSWDVANLAEACAFRDAAGRSGCLLVVGDFRPAAPGEEAMLFLWNGHALQRQDLAAGADPQVGDWRGAAADRALFEAIHDGRFTIGPARTNALQIGEADLLMDP